MATGVETIGLGLGQSLIAPTVLVAAGTFLWNLVLGWLRERRRARNFLKALYAEVCFNMKDLNDSLEAYDANRIASALRANADLVPHLADSRHTDIYRRQIERIEVLRGAELRMMIKFYGGLDQIKSRVDALQYASFKTISIEGKIITIQDIYDTVRKNLKVGESLLRELEDGRVYIRATE